MKPTSLTYRKREIHYCLIEAEKTISSPILLLGGVLQNMQSWKSYVKDLTATNSVLVIDLPGIGSGQVLDASYGFDFLADCVHRVIDHLGIKKVNIFSTSYSSIIAYEFSARYHHLVDKLIISSSMAFLPDAQKKVMMDCIAALEQKDLGKFYNTFIDGVCSSHGLIPNYDLSRKVIEILVNKLTDEEIRQFIENTKRVLLYKKPDSQHHAIPLKPLIFTGEYDNFTPPELCRGIGQFYTNSYFGTIKNYDHLFHIGNREAIINSMLPFFQNATVPAFCSKNDYIALPKTQVLRTRRKEEQEEQDILVNNIMPQVMPPNYLSL